MMKKLWCLLLAVLMVLNLLPICAMAEGTEVQKSAEIVTEASSMKKSKAVQAESGLLPEPADALQEADLLDVDEFEENEETKYLDESTVNLNGTYILKDSLKNEKRLNVRGSAIIILPEGMTLTLPKGIRVGLGNKLTIRGTGTLIANAERQYAAIGGDDKESGGTVIIEGGNILATGSLASAAIGGGYEGNGCDITITGGTVTATGGNIAAAIGGGNQGSGSNVTITGGTVTAQGGESAAAIGGGSHGNGGDITIIGGTVTAIGGRAGAGIGGGWYGTGGNITITGGTVTAHGGDDAPGIGGGSNGNGGNVKIDGADVTAVGSTGIATTFTYKIAGIGGGYRSKDNGTLEVPLYQNLIYVDGGELPVYRYNLENQVRIVRDELKYIDEDATDLTGTYTLKGSLRNEKRLNVHGNALLVLPEGMTLTLPKGIRVGQGSALTIRGTGTLIANAENRCAAIGGNEKESGGTIAIEDGDIQATGGKEAAAIGGGYAGNGGDITISGGTVKANADNEGGAGIGGGTRGGGGNITISGGTVTAEGGMLSAAIGGGIRGGVGNITISGGTVTAEACFLGMSGIGGGSHGDDGNITITGGTVTANGFDGAGIGGGTDHGCGNIIISGGTVTATSIEGAGIGGGQFGGGGKLTISGGTVTATSYDLGAGIGGGMRGGGANVTISGGTVTASGGDAGAGIGGGNGAGGGDLTVTGGTVTVTGGVEAAGIGSGGYITMGEWRGNGGKVAIKGGTVTVTGGIDAAGIGGGKNSAGADVIISGGTVRATGGGSCSAIGKGRNDNAPLGTLELESEMGVFDVRNEKAPVRITDPTPQKLNGITKIEVVSVKADTGRRGYVSMAASVTADTDKADDTNVPETASGNPFVDVTENDYFNYAVLWAVEKNITDGTDSTHFSPFVPITRAQAVTFLWRAAGSPVVNYFMQMDDVNPDAYYAEAVRWALSEKITKGTGETTFSPDKLCTRAEIVTLLARFAGVTDADTASVFSDVDPSDYFASAVKWAKDNQVTDGTSPETFSPNEKCTRAQVLTFLHRWMTR